MKSISPDAATRPTPGLNVTIHIPDGQKPIPVHILSIEEIDDGEGDGGIFEIKGTALADGNYGFGEEERPYRFAEPIVVYVTWGDEWVAMTEQ